MGTPLSMTPRGRLRETGTPHGYPIWASFQNDGFDTPPLHFFTPPSPTPAPGPGPKPAFPDSKCPSAHCPHLPRSALPPGSPPLTSGGPARAWPGPTRPAPLPELPGELAGELPGAPGGEPRPPSPVILSLKELEFLFDAVADLQDRELEGLTGLKRGLGGTSEV